MIRQRIDSKGLVVLSIFQTGWQAEALPDGLDAVRYVVKASVGGEAKEK